MLFLVLERHNPVARVITTVKQIDFKKRIESKLMNYDDLFYRSSQGKLIFFRNVYLV